jgi:hypothetical protein
MPYRHPVAVAVSVLWWGLYCGGFGVSIGALLVFFSKREPAVPESVEGVGKGREQLAAGEEADLGCGGAGVAPVRASRRLLPRYDELRLDDRHGITLPRTS